VGVVLASAGEAHPRSFWWNAEDENCHNEVFASVEHLRKQQEYRRAAYIHFLRLYSNRLARDLTGEDFASAIDGGDKIRLNVVKSAIDTSVAMISASRARPLYMSIGGTYDTRKRAERQSQWTLGAFLKLKHYILSLDVFRDGGIFGDGYERPYNYEGQLFTERLFPDEVVVDDNDGKTSQPIQAFIVKSVDKYWFAEFWPDFKDDILAADSLENPIATREGLTDPCSVVMAFKPSTYEGAKDGRQAICVSGKTLLDEVYEPTEYPWAHWQWNTSPLGYHGMGGAEELAPIQIEVNYIAQKIQKLMTLATSVVWSEKGSGITKMSSQDWAVREYRGKPPIFQNISSVSAEYFSHMDRLYQRGYELMGISQLAAGGVKPPGIDSGEGLRTFHDIGQKRFQHTGQRWDQHHIDCAELYLEQARQMTKAGFNPTMLYHDHQDSEEIDFKEAMLEKNKYLVRVQPASLLPEDPAGKIEMLGKLAQAYPDMAPHLVALMATVPDLEYAVKMVRAPMEIAEKHVNLILEHGKVEQPHPMMDLGLSRLVAQRALLNAWVEGVSEDRQEALRRYIGQIDKLQGLQQQKALPPPSQPPMPPPGMMSGPTPPPAMAQPPMGGPPPG
jgi:hypothetical protein